MQELQEPTALLTPASAAAILGISTQTLREYEKKGKIKVALRTDGRQRRYSLAEVNRFLRSNTDTERDATRIDAQYPPPDRAGLAGLFDREQEGF